MDFDTFPFASFSQYLANGSFFLPVKNHVPMFGCNICSSITSPAGGAKSTVSDEKHLRNKQERFFEVNIAKKEPMQRIGSFQIHTIGTAFSVGIPNDAIPFLCFLSSESIFCLLAPLGFVSERIDKFCNAYCFRDNFFRCTSTDADIFIPSCCDIRLSAFSIKCRRIDQEQIVSDACSEHFQISFFFCPGLGEKRTGVWMNAI